MRGIVRVLYGFGEGGKGVELTDTLDSRGVLDRIEKVPGLRKRAGTGWDGAALKKPVLANQRERQVVQSAGKPKWDFQRL